MSDSGSDDDWYNQMDQMAQQYGDDMDGVVDTFHAKNVVDDEHTVEVSEEEYFNMISDNSNTISENCFLGETDIIWQGIARKVASDSLDQVSRHASRLTKVIPNEDSCSLLLIQQWLFTFLPHSLKSYALLMNDALLFCAQRQFYVDNKLHPSIWAATNYSSSTNSVDVIFFAPYKTYDSCKKMFVELMFQLQRAYSGVKVKLTGVDVELYEMAMNPFTVGPAAIFKELWVENCGMYVYEAKWSHSHVDLPVGYVFCSLSETDCEIINETWKYKSSDSIHMVRRMVMSGKCLGIKFGNTLVSWCLTYDEGSLGMLYALNDHRGKGLGKKVVIELINRLFASEASSMNIPTPFCYIEISNQNSKNIFCSLGFTKCADVVWVGLEYIQAAKS